MPGCLFANWWLVVLAAATFAFGQDRAEPGVKDSATAEKLAREAFSKVFEIPDDAVLAVLEKNGEVKLCAWRVDAPGKDLPEPTAIAQAFFWGRRRIPIRQWCSSVDGWMPIATATITLCTSMMPTLVCNGCPATEDRIS